MRKYFLTGLLVLVPLAITAWVLSLIISTLDQSLLIVPEAWQPRTVFGMDIPGFGAILTLAIVFLTGLLTNNLVGEKIQKRFLGLGHPDSSAIRAGHANIHTHLDYIVWLTERRSWLAGETFSLADIAAAAHLSCLDYIGDVPWDDHPDARIWYARLKSRRAFRPILADHIPGVPPPKHYADPDF